MFIVFEGCELVGKTTQIRLLADAIKATEPDREIVLTREPGGTPLGDKWRKDLLSPAHVIDPVSDALGFATIRSLHLNDVVKPALDRGAVVICDRFIPSSLVYQCLTVGERAKAMPYTAIRDLNEGILDLHGLTNAQQPHYFLLDVPVPDMVERGQGRAVDASDKNDVDRTTSRLTALREAYLSLLVKQGLGQYNMVIRGEQAPEKVHADIWHMYKHWTAHHGEAQQ